MVIDAHEGRDVAVFDIPGAYLNTWLPGARYEVIKFEGNFAHIVIEVWSELKEDIVVEHDKDVLYLRIVP